MADALKTSMANGEVSPKLYARVDLERYHSSLRTCRNFFTLPQGGASNRPGTEFIGRTKFPGTKARLMPFEYNTEQTYVLEMGDRYFRIIKDGGHVLEPSVAVTAISQADPGVVTAAAHGYEDGDWVFIDDSVVGMSEVHNKTYLVNNKSTNTFELQDLDGVDVDTSGFTAYSSGGTVARIKTVLTPYLEVELPTLKFTHAGDVMTIAHPNHALRELSRGTAGHYDFSLNIIAFTPSISPPTVKWITQDWRAAIQDTDQTETTHVNLRFQNNNAVAKSFTVGQRVWVQAINGAVGLNNKWYLVSYIHALVDGRSEYISIVNTNGSSLDGTALNAYTGGGFVYTEEDLRYRVTTIDAVTGEESLASSDLVLPHANDLGLQGINLVWQPLPGTDPFRTQPVSRYNIYKEKTGIFGYIGSSGGRIENEDYLAIDGITQANPGVVTTIAAHGLENGEKVYFFGIFRGMTELIGNTYVAGNVTTFTFELRTFRQQNLDTSGFGFYRTLLRGITDITQDADGGVVTTSAAHEYIEGDMRYINDVVGMIEVNDTNFTIGEVLSTTTFRLADLDGVSVDTSGFSAYASAGNCHEPGFCARSTYFFFDDNIDPDLVDVAPPQTAIQPFLNEGDFPASVAHHEQRMAYARTDNDRQKLWFSQTGNLHNMNVGVPSKVDDAMDFTLAALRANEIRHIIAMGELVILTSGAEWLSSSGQNPYILANIYNRPRSFIGCADYPAPLLATTHLLFVDSTGSDIYEVLFFLDTSEFRTDSVSLLSDHLFRGKEILEWAYARRPDGIAWVTLDDGSLLGMTYLPKQEIRGWHRHDTDGQFESTCSIREGDEDAVYFITRRTIDGSALRYIERMHTRNFSDIRDAFFVDSGLSLDVPLPITAATATDPVEITSAAHGLSEGDDVDISDIVGMTELNDLRFKAANTKTDTLELVDEYHGNSAIISSLSQANPCLVTGIPNGAADLQPVWIQDCVGMVEVNDRYFVLHHIMPGDTWQLRDFDGANVDSTAYGAYSGGGRIELVTTVDGSAYTTYESAGYLREAVQTLTGLDHLEAKSVSILSDGNVMPPQTVIDGSITLPGRKGSRVHVGLPYTCDLETLDMSDIRGFLAGRKKAIPRAHLRFMETRTGQVGLSADKLITMNDRDRESYNAPTALQEGEFSYSLPPDWNFKGRVFVRQTEPLPMTVLSIAVDVERSDG